MVLEIPSVSDDPRRLSQTVTQITTFLDLYNAELARILGVQCADIGRLTSGSRCLAPGTPEWKHACLYVRLYRALYRYKAGDGVAMRHWLRTDNRELGGTPHLLIVDQGRLAEVAAYLEQRAGTGD